MGFPVCVVTTQVRSFEAVMEGNQPQTIDKRVSVTLFQYSRLDTKMRIAYNFYSSWSILFF